MCSSKRGNESRAAKGTGDYTFRSCSPSLCLHLVALFWEPALLCATLREKPHHPSARGQNGWPNVPCPKDCTADNLYQLRVGTVSTYITN